MSQAASTVEVPAKAPAAEASGAAIVQDAGVSSAGNSAANLGSDGQQHARVTVLVETVGDSGVVATAHPVLQWLGWLIKPWVRLVTALPGDIMSLRWYEAVSCQRVYVAGSCPHAHMAGNCARATRAKWRFAPHAPTPCRSSSSSLAA